MEKHRPRVLLKSQKCLIMQPEIVEKLGRSAALVLQQLHFFLTASNQMGKILGDRRWIYNSLDAWQDCIKVLSKSTIKRAFEKLKAAGIVVANNFNSNASNRTLWYTIDYENLASFLEPTQTTETSKTLSFKPLVQKFKMTSSSDQNEIILYSYSQITSDNQSLQNTPQDIQKNNLSQEANTLQLQASTTLPRSLLEIWNEVTGQSCELTVKRASHLMAAYKIRFGSCLDQWKAYCQRVASSAFLMGKVKSTFRASLDWVLKFDTITRIMEGDFGVQSMSDKTLDGATQDQAELEKNKIFREGLEASTETPEVRGIRLKLLDLFGASIYSNWFQRVQFSVMGEGRVILKSPTAFGADYLESQFGWKLEKLLGSGVIFEVAT